MAKIELPYSPDLTVEDIIKSLRTRFASKGYTVAKSKLIGADLVLRKTSWVGVSIKLKQKDNSTFIRMNGLAPDTWTRVLMSILFGVIAYIFLIPKWNKLVKEIKEYILSPDFGQKEIEFGRKEQFLEEAEGRV